MMNLNPAIKIKSNALLFAPILIIFVGVISLIAVGVMSPKSTDPACNSTSTTTTQNTLYSSANTSSDGVIAPTCPTPAGILVAIPVFYLAILVSIILFLVWEWSYAHGVSEITGEKLGFALALIVLIVVPDGIDILILQDYFNKVDGGLTPASMPQVAPVAPVPPSPPILPQ